MKCTNDMVSFKKIFKEDDEEDLLRRTSSSRLCLRPRRMVPHRLAHQFRGWLPEFSAEAGKLGKERKSIDLFMEKSSSWI